MIKDDATSVTLDWDQNPTEERQKIPRGTALGRYVIIEPIGEGGMGAVYRAFDPELNRGVALKILSVKHLDPKAAQLARTRLIREAQALAQLSHPNVIAVHDVGSFGDDVFITIELVDGKTLKDWLAEPGHSYKEKLAILIDAGKGLYAAHKAGLVHRDFKPGNVIIGKDGRVRVLDFGLAQAVDETIEQKRKELLDSGPEGDENTLSSALSSSSTDSDSSGFYLSHLTKTGGMLGTPLYMAPEQHLGDETDARSDQFSFCLVLYEALYEQRPYKASTLKKLRKMVIQQKISPPPRDSQVPKWIYPIILKGLQTDPDKRHATMEQILEQLQRDPEVAWQQRRAARLRRLLIGLVVTLVFVVPVAVWYGLRIRTVQLCKDASSMLEKVWATPHREAIQSAFLKTGQSYAADTWQRVQRSFDNYVRSWVAMREQVCEDTWLRGTQSEELLDLRMGCLSDRLGELQALGEVFAQADETIVQKAAQASASLTAIGICADEKALRLPYAPPSDETTIKQVKLIQEGISQVTALSRTGKYNRGVALAQKLLLQADESNYDPIRAQVLTALGKVLDKAGDVNSAYSTFLQAAQLAGRIQDGRLLSHILVNQVFVVGYKQNKHELGLALSRDAQVVLQLVGGDKNLEANLLGHQGVISSMAGEHAQALQYFQQAIEVRTKAFGPEDSELGRDYNNLSVAYYSEANYEKAREYQERALAIKEKVLGPKHPSVAYSLNNLGLVHFELGQYAIAKEKLQRALRVSREAYGANHPFVAWPLQGLGAVLLKQGEFEKAQKFFEEALAICSKKVCQPQPLHGAQFGLAMVLVRENNQTNRALQLAHQAQAGYKKVEKRFRKELAAVESWLKSH